MPQKNISITDDVERVLVDFCTVRGLTQSRAVSAAIVMFVESTADDRESALLRLHELEANQKPLRIAGSGGEGKVSKPRKGRRS